MSGPTEALDVKPDFSTAFWGEGDRGLDVLMARMRQGKHITDQILSLFNERALIEEEYSKKLVKLAKTFTIKEEIGTLRESLEVVKNELETSAKAHGGLAVDIKTQLAAPTAEFMAQQRAIRKSHHTQVEKQMKAKHAQEVAVFKMKERSDARAADVARLQAGGMANANDKTRIKMEKAQLAARGADQEYLGGTEKLHELHQKWVEDWTAACRECQVLEEKRIDYIRSHLWTYANLFSTVCVADDEACEHIRSSLEKCDISKDLMTFLSSQMTGSQVPVPHQYANASTASAFARPSQPPNHPAISAPVSSYGAGSQDLGPDRAGAGAAASTSYHAAEMAYNAGAPPSVAPSLGPGGAAMPPYGYGGRAESLPGSNGLAPAPTAVPAGASLGGGYDAAQSSVASLSGGGGIANAGPLGGSASVGGSGGALAGPSAVVPSESSAVSGAALGGAAAAPDAGYTYDPYNVPETVDVLCTVRALYDYAAQAPEELTLVKGQSIPVIAKNADGWWEGIAVEADGRRRVGLFPSNFCDGA